MGCCVRFWARNEITDCYELRRFVCAEGVAFGAPCGVVVPSQPKCLPRDPLARAPARVWGCSCSQPFAR